MRSGQPRNPKEKIPDHVHLLIWAASPKDSFPLDFEFDLIVDLNYREDSMARELALSKGKPYLGGDLMFKEQAAGQRRHWNLRVPAGFNI